MVMDAVKHHESVKNFYSYENLKMRPTDFYVKYSLIFTICSVFVVICNTDNQSNIYSNTLQMTQCGAQAGFDLILNEMKITNNLIFK